MLIQNKHKPSGFCRLFLLRLLLLFRDRQVDDGLLRVDGSGIRGHRQAFGGTGADAAAAEHAHERLDLPYPRVFYELYAIARTGLLAFCAEYAFLSIVDDVTFGSGDRSLLLERVLERLRLLEDRGDRHAGHFESTHVTTSQCS